jgi:hypothetical protein
LKATAHSQGPLHVFSGEPRAVQSSVLLNPFFRPMSSYLHSTLYSVCARATHHASTVTHGVSSVPACCATVCVCVCILCCARLLPSHCLSAMNVICTPSLPWRHEAHLYYRCVPTGCRMESHGGQYSKHICAYIYSILEH